MAEAEAARLAKQPKVHKLTGMAPENLNMLAEVLGEGYTTESSVHYVRSGLSLHDVNDVDLLVR